MYNKWLAITVTWQSMGSNLEAYPPTVVAAFKSERVEEPASPERPIVSANANIYTNQRSRMELG